MYRTALNVACPRFRLRLCKVYTLNQLYTQLFYVFSFHFSEMKTAVVCFWLSETRTWSCSPCLSDIEIKQVAAFLEPPMHASWYRKSFFFLWKFGIEKVSSISPHASYATTWLLSHVPWRCFRRPLMISWSPRVCLDAPNPPQNPNFPSHLHHIEILNIANDCMKY